MVMAIPVIEELVMKLSTAWAPQTKRGCQPQNQMPGYNIPKKYNDNSNLLC